MTNIVTPTPIDELPPAPVQTLTRTEFTSRASAFVAAQTPFRNQINAIAGQTHTNATAAHERAQTAQDAAQSAVQGGAAQVQLAEAARVAAEAAAALAVNAPTTYGTSTSTLTIGTGAQALTVETGRAFVPTQDVVITSTADPSGSRMWGQVSAYDEATGALAVNVIKTLGSGSASSWVVTLSTAPPDSAALTHVVASANTTAVAGAMYQLATAGITLTLPAAPADDDVVGFCNTSGGNCTINFNGKTLLGQQPVSPFSIRPLQRAIIRYSAAGGTWL